MPLPLKDKWIVVTRPSHQSKPMEKKLRLAGANVISFPLLAIDSATDEAFAKKQLAKIAQYDLLIFVSANAVKRCFSLASVKDFKSIKIAAVGKKTVRQLEQYDLHADIFPQTLFNSEALLSLDEIKMLNASNNVAIIRGEGGRDLLKTALQAQGVNVDYIDVYKQYCPQETLATLSQYNQQKNLDIILLTSGNSARNLFSLQRDDANTQWLNTVPLMAGSERIKQKILTTTPHAGKIEQAEDPSDETLFQQLLSWAEKDNTSKP